MFFTQANIIEDKELKPLNCSFKAQCYVRKENICESMLIFVENLAGFHFYFLKGRNGTKTLQSTGHRGSESDHTAQIVSHFTDIWSRTESFRHFCLSPKIANCLIFRLVLAHYLQIPFLWFRSELIISSHTGAKQALK